MHEQIAKAVYYLEVHLLYASLVWLAAWVLTSSERGSATTKYWIWVATSLNFILPVGAILDAMWAAHLSWARPLTVVGDAANGILENAPAAALLGILWVLGAAMMFTRLLLRLRAERRDTRATAPQSPLDAMGSFLAEGVPVRFGGAGLAPAVGGVLRPRISLPRGIDRLLSQPELKAVLIHEVTHARRRDNLIRLVHEVGLSILWFHPFVWLTGSRLALYRELSCDESVIESAHGADLVSALAKLAHPAAHLLLQATFSSFLSHRIARLTAAEPRTRVGANALLVLVFGAVLLAALFETVAHTACCFVART